MDIEILTVENKEYYIIEKISNDNNKYYILINVNDNTDLIIRKLLKENNEEYLTKLGSIDEYNFVMQKYLDIMKSIDKYKFLPIGTIVKLTQSNLKIMITGYLMKSDKNLVFDYCGCVYTLGITDQNSIYYFDKKDI